MRPTVTSSQPATDPDFFFSIVQFQVEGVLFGIPDYVCEESKSFHARITAGQQPCVLEDVTAVEFRDFLQCLIAPLSCRRAAAEAECSPESKVGIDYMKRWVNTLKLATRWGFEDMRWAAIREIEAMDDPPLKLAVGREYDVPWFLPDALRDLADTKVMTPLNKEDYEILGLDLAIKVAQFRERYNGLPVLSENPEVACHELIEEVFGAEFAKVVKEAWNPLLAPSEPQLPGRRRAQRERQ